MLLIDIVMYPPFFFFDFFFLFKQEKTYYAFVNLPFVILFSVLDFEASFIRLLDKVTNGSRIEINQTGKH